MTFERSKLYSSAWSTTQFAASVIMCSVSLNVKMGDRPKSTFTTQMPVFAIQVAMPRRWYFRPASNPPPWV